MKPHRKPGRVLVTGATGALGGRIAASDRFGDVLAPTRAEMDIRDASAVRRYVAAHPFDVVVHTAAMARMVACEEDPVRALETNLVGTANLVTALIDAARQDSVRFLHISTDAVYAGVTGNYEESDATVPYNVYGWTKLGAEAAVRVLPDHVIARTRFFVPGALRFDTAATDAFSSGLPVAELVDALEVLLRDPLVGTVNVGGRRMSEYERYRAVKPSIRPASIDEVEKGLPFRLPRDASMNVDLWRNIQKGAEEA